MADRLFLQSAKVTHWESFKHTWEKHVLILKYGHFILMGSFNSQPDETFMSDFMELCNFKNLVKLPICFKNPENPSCINLFLTNRPGWSQDNHVFKSSISDFHKLVVNSFENSF